MSMDPLAATYLAGLAFGAISMMSIGPNNVLLLREGLSGGRPVTVATVMWLSYALLLGLAVFAGHWVRPILMNSVHLLQWGGAFALAVMGVMALRQSRQSAFDLRAAHRPSQAISAATQRVLRVVWMNPLTYLELLVIPAALALALDGLEQRVAIFAGLLSAFAVNCFGFSLTSGLLQPVFQNSRNLRLFDAASGLAMIVLAGFTAVAAVTVASTPSSATHSEQKRASHRELGSVSRPADVRTTAP